MKQVIIEKRRIPKALKKTIVIKERAESSVLRDIGVLLLRLTMGGLLAGHGSQKLFGWQRSCFAVSKSFWKPCSSMVMVRIPVVSS